MWVFMSGAAVRDTNPRLNGDSAKQLIAGLFPGGSKARQGCFDNERLVV
jgi:hypothetical protein